MNERCQGIRKKNGRQCDRRVPKGTTLCFTCQKTADADAKRTDTSRVGGESLPTNRELLEAIARDKKHPNQVQALKFLLDLDQTPNDGGEQARRRAALLLSHLSPEEKQLYDFARRVRERLKNLAAHRFDDTRGQQGPHTGPTAANQALVDFAETFQIPAFTQQDHDEAMAAWRQRNVDEGQRLHQEQLDALPAKSAPVAQLQPTEESVEEDERETYDELNARLAREEAAESGKGGGSW